MSYLSQIDPRPLDKSKCRDTGMAIALIPLIVFFIKGGKYWYGNETMWVSICLALILIAMLAPKLLYPLAFLWWGFANVMGGIMSFILLGIIFLLVVLPVSIFRRLRGKDAMRMKEWKNDNVSYFEVRNHEFKAEDLKTPY